MAIVNNVVSIRDILKLMVDKALQNKTSLKFMTEGKKAMN